MKNMNFSRPSINEKKMDAIYTFIKNFKNLRFEDLPEEVVEATKKAFVDTVGVALAGIKEKGPKEIIEILSAWELKGKCSIFGIKRRLPPPYAAQINATMIHALDYDDVHERAIIHPSVITIPSAIAAAEERGGLSGKEFIRAVSFGSDMICRLGLSLRINPIKTGFHLTTLFGYIVSALVSGEILGLSEGELINACGIAYHQCSGNGQAVRDGALTKRLGPGFAVRGGIMASLMAMKGLTGAKNSLEGDWGLYRVYFKGEYDREVLLSHLGTDFESINVSIKPYPCCRGTHASADAALELARTYNIKKEEIEKVRIYVGEANHFLLCTPQERKKRPENPVDTQFSIPWVVASALSKGRIGMEHFTREAIMDEDILLVCERIETFANPAFNREKGDEPALVEVIRKDGKIFSSYIEHPLGSPQKPMSFEDCAQKFKDCIASSGINIPENRIDEILEKVSNLENLENIVEIVDLLKFLD